MTRPAFFILGLGLAAALWFAAGAGAGSDVHGDLRDCRAALDAFLAVEVGE